MAKNRNTSWVALGTAGAIGAAAMYGVSRMNQNGTMQKAADNTRQALSKESLQNLGGPDSSGSPRVHEST